MLEILEVFATAFCVKNYYLNLIFFRYGRLLSLKKKKRPLKKIEATQKLLDIVTNRRKTLQKEKQKRKMRKSQTATIAFLLLLFYVKKHIF